jgi:putative transposase
MPRPLRPQIAGATYHLTARGNRRSVIYRDDGDHVFFLSVFLIVLSRFGWKCHAWCLMTTHYHLLLMTPEPNIALGMQYLNSRYAEGFNHRYGLRGHLFEGRYAHRLIETDEHLVRTYRYIARNPVRAGICERASDWPWSSYSGLVHGWEGHLYREPSLTTHFEGERGLRALQQLIESSRWRPGLARRAMAGV